MSGLAINYTDSNQYNIDETIEIVTQPNECKIFNANGKQIAIIKQDISRNKILRSVFKKRILPFAFQIKKSIQQTKKGISH